MFRKAAAAILLLMGIACAAFGHHVYKDPVSLGSCAETADGTFYMDNEGGLVLTSGTLSWKEGARDDELGVSSDALILIRTAEVYSAADAGFIHADDSAPIKSAVFLADDIRIGKDLLISSEYAEKLALDSYSDLSNVYPLTDYTDLPYLESSDPELGTYRGFYATPHSGWEDGDLKISYRVLDSSSLGEFSVLGRQKDGTLVPDGAPCSIWDRNVTSSELFPDLGSASRTVITVLFTAAGVLILLSALLFVPKRKKTSV